MAVDSAKISIGKMARQADVDVCARFMCDSDPWKTLGVSFERAQHVLTDPSREIYLGQIAGQPVGFMILQMQGALVGYIQSICVHPDWRNQGIGEQLIKFAEERIFQDSPNVFLFVSSFNEAAERFYQRLGYEVIGPVENFIISGHAEILMRKTTGPWSEFR